MSSVHCKKCHERIWDKVKGFSAGCGEVRIDDNVFSVCGFCGHKELLK